MQSEQIKRSIQVLQLSFDELSTHQFEQRTDTAKFIKRNHLNLGSILRINEEFKIEIERLMIAWFAECAALSQMRLIRHITSTQSEHFESNYHRYKHDTVGFEEEEEDKMSLANVDHDDQQHHIALYSMSKVLN